MNEIEIINTIKNKLNNKYLGDDCAYLKDIGIVVSQDSLVENIHFKRNWCTPYQLGYKALTVNISDILASGAVPKYATVALSLPENIDYSFIDEFYSGAISALNGVNIVGGDITGSKDSIIISVTVIGTTGKRNISSRKNAKIGYSIITSGFYGTSAAGLNELIKSGNNQIFIKAHLEPKLDYNFSEQISTLTDKPYAMMDTSDGLADALFKIAEASGVKAIVNFADIKHYDSITKEQVLFGGEDYNLLAVVPNNILNKIPNAYKIGDIVEFDGIRLDISGDKYFSYSELSVYNHFGVSNG